MLDLRIEGGTLIDGSGSPGRPGDLGIRDGRIVALGEFDEPARESIDASGLAVAPGFVDIHTHYDAQAFWDPSLSPSSLHGVTTIVGGNCGFSIAPLSGDSRDSDYVCRMLARVEGMPIETLRTGVPWDWRSFEEYLARHEGRLALNAGFMVGHSAIRRAVMGERAVGGKASAADIAAMCALLEQSLAAGGLGLSTTVSVNHTDWEGNPVPSRHAAREEMLALAQVVGRHEGSTLEFLPGFFAGVDEAKLALMIDMSLAAQRSVNWNLVNPDSNKRAIYEAQLAASDRARARGARLVPLVGVGVISAWMNLFTGTGFDMFPGWGEVMRLPLAERRRALGDGAVRTRLEADGRAEAIGRGDWAAYTLAEITHPGYRRFQGGTTGEAAAVLGCTPFDALLDIALADDLKTLFLAPRRGTDDESWAMRGAAWRDPRTIVGASDAGAHSDMIDTFASCTQLLGTGVRRRALIGLEEAVRQLSSVPASLVGLRERGRLAPGYRADVTVFDPATVDRGPVHMRFDLPGGAGRLYAGAIGIRHVIVNGVETVRGQDLTGRHPGQLIRSGRDTATVSLDAAAWPPAAGATW